MDYKKHYTLLIERAKSRRLSGYTETHHIIPKCLGGSDHITNLVDLTPEEHYLAHLLLVKIYPNESGLVWAALMMTGGGAEGTRTNNKAYGWLKNKQSVIAKQRVGDKNGSFGKRWYYDPDTGDCIKCDDNNIPNGWVAGRVVSREKFFKIKSKTIEANNKKQQRVDFLKEIMYYYRDNDISIREVANHFGVNKNIYIQLKEMFGDEYLEIVKHKPRNSNISKRKYI